MIPPSAAQRPTPETSLGTQTDMDLRPHYTLNWLPAPGQSAVIKVRARYLYKGEEFGNWSEWHTFCYNRP